MYRYLWLQVATRVGTNTERIRLSSIKEHRLWEPKEGIETRENQTNTTNNRKSSSEACHLAITKRCARGQSATTTFLIHHTPAIRRTLSAQLKLATRICSLKCSRRSRECIGFRSVHGAQETCSPAHHCHTQKGSYSLKFRYNSLIQTPQHENLNNTKARAQHMLTPDSLEIVIDECIELVQCEVHVATRHLLEEQLPVHVHGSQAQSIFFVQFLLPQRYDMCTIIP